MISATLTRSGGRIDQRSRLAEILRPDRSGRDRTEGHGYKSHPKPLKPATVKGVPFDHHRGVYRTEPDGAGTRFTFHLELSSRLPGLAWLIRRPLEAINRRGFDNLARQLEARASDR